MSQPNIKHTTPRGRLFPALRALSSEAPLPITVRGSSMAPALVAGQRVSIATKGIYLPGDIVAFRAADDSMVIHRLAGYRKQKKHWRIVTRGDAAPNFDAPVSVERVLGKIIAIESKPWRANILDRCKAAASFFNYLTLAVLRRLHRIGK